MSTITSPASTSSDHTSDDAQPRRRSRVSAEHTLNRVRENQRRHRARQRDRVTSLEEKLAETEKLLAEARAEIEFLKASQEATTIMCRNSQVEIPRDFAACDVHENVDNTPKPSELAVINEEAGPQFPYLGNPDLSFLGNDVSSAFIIDINNLAIPVTTTTEGLESVSGPPPCCSDTASLPLPDEHADPECSTCKTKPPPDPSESTTLCAQAFVLISQQNFRNLDPETIRMWLAQGLRRAQREGEGCRVENGALLRLLDYISGI
ncbi:hypothetical protein IQ06DRAFT_290671 [Phaeosphaeriaceae sp. SRC1lsM3a]|nr:hypothetical protein IQ06DRAFT_290671 [Stagonospora sp. SRC1lsM3a]